MDIDELMDLATDIEEELGDMVDRLEVVASAGLDPDTETFEMLTRYRDQLREIASNIQRDLEIAAEADGFGAPGTDEDED